MKEAELQRKTEEAQEALARMGAARRAALLALEKNPNMPLDEMPDCEKKLNKIRETFANVPEKFTDV